MKSNSAARRLLGMDHWPSNTQLMQYVSWHEQEQENQHLRGLQCEREVLTFAISPINATYSQL